MKAEMAVFLGVAFLMMVLLVLPLGCAKETETEAPAPTEFKTYSKYGLSFEYPRGYSISEMGLLQSEANDSSGIVQASKGEEEFYQASWIGMVEDVWEVAGDLQLSLEDGFAAAEQTEGIARVDRGELGDTTKAGHQMLYQFYSMTTTEGDEAYGIQGVFYCDKSERFFQLLTIHSAISVKQEILEDFQRFLDSFVCH